MDMPCCSSDGPPPRADDDEEEEEELLLLLLPGIVGALVCPVGDCMPHPEAISPPWPAPLAIMPPEGPTARCG